MCSCYPGISQIASNLSRREPPTLATVLTVPQGVEDRTSWTLHAVQTVVAVEKIHGGLNQRKV